MERARFLIGSFPTQLEPTEMTDISLVDLSNPMLTVKFVISTQRTKKSSSSHTAKATNDMTLLARVINTIRNTIGLNDTGMKI